jgi:hypothetical protein
MSTKLRHARDNPINYVRSYVSTEEDMETMARLLFPDPGL